jgi:hypothetical protein
MTKQHHIPDCNMTADTCGFHGKCPNCKLILSLTAKLKAIAGEGKQEGG